MTIHRRMLKRLQYEYIKIGKSPYILGIYSNKGLCLPDFLGIGAQRSGTTWLNENLRRHPEIYLPDQKMCFRDGRLEVHYFDREFHRSLKYYAGKFKPGCQMVKGDITPGYSFIPVERIRFIRAVMPDVRLIFLMRNPIGRSWSQAIMNLVRHRNRKFEQVNESEFYAHFKSASSMKRGNYPTILSNWLSVFPREQVYIGFFEDIGNHPRRLLSEVFDHIDVSRDIDWDSFPYKQVINKNPNIPMPQQYRHFLEEMYCQDIEALYEQFGSPIAGWRC